jgi:hypothetical protein
MDYDKFKLELEEYDKWEENNFRLNSPMLNNKVTPLTPKAELDSWNRLADNMNVDLAPEITQKWFDSLTEDRVNSPSHYTRGSQEVIVTIEEAIEDAPSVSYGMLQGQALKYLLRVWLKDNPLEDLKKCRWYLTRLIDKLEGDKCNH